MSHMLELSQVDAFYGKIQALKGITLSIKRGEIAALLGSNGAGKSTTLKAISGLVRIQNGSIRFLGEDMTKLSPHEIVERGVVHVPEGRRIFGSMTVLENLELGAFTKRKDAAFVKRTMEHVFELFPRLKERQKQKAGTFSGGEQQMLAIARAIMSDPKLLLLDEPSMGLAPIIVQEIMKIIKQINAEGTTVLLIEQNAKAALKIAHTGYVIETGQITIHDSAEKLQQDDSIVKAYLAQ